MLFRSEQGKTTEVRHAFLGDVEQNTMCRICIYDCHSLIYIFFTYYFVLHSQIPTWPLWANPISPNSTLLHSTEPPIAFGTRKQLLGKLNCVPWFTKKKKMKGNGHKLWDSLPFFKLKLLEKVERSFPRESYFQIHPFRSSFFFSLAKMPVICH